MKANPIRRAAMGMGTVGGLAGNDPGSSGERHHGADPFSQHEFP